MRDPGLRDQGVELKVGALVLVGAVVLVWGLFWISGSSFRGPSITVWGVTEDAGQITTDSRVFLRGVDVGSVEGVTLTATEVIVEINISPGVELGNDTRGTIRPAGFLGQQMLELLPGASTVPLSDGDTLAVGRNLDIMSVASNLGEDTEAVLGRIRDILSDEMILNIGGVTEGFARTADELQDLLSSQRASLQAILANADTLSGRLVELSDSEEAKRTLSQIETLATSAAAASVELQRTSESLASILDGLAAGEGTLGKLLQEDGLHDDLFETMGSVRAAGEELALLIKDIRERPERYLQGIRVSVF